MTQKIAPCPEQELLQKIAAGECPPETDKIVSHAAQCKTCGPLLKKYLAAFSDETTPEETAFISKLHTSDPGYQREWLKENVLHTPAPVRVPVPAPIPIPKPWFRWAWAGFASAAAALVVAISAWFLLPVFQFNSAVKLVGVAFKTSPREERFAHAPYAPYVESPVVQGGGAAGFNNGLNPAWIKAENAVLEKLDSGDPKWLQLQARMLLLRAAPGDVEKAEELLENARQKGVSSPGLEIDLANAYFEHEKLLHPDAPNLQKTMDLLNKVLHEPSLSQEDRRVALFNLALAYQKSNMWDLAVQTWDEYLRKDSSGAWADDARRQRDAAKEKVPVGETHDRGSPEAFLEQYFRGSLRPEDPEIYQDKALMVWIPRGLADQRNNYWLASNKLAEVLEKKTLIRG